MNSYAIFTLIENKVNERKILSYALDFYIFQEQLALFFLNSIIIFGPSHMFELGTIADLLTIIILNLTSL